jgi:hypothetical protein
MLIFQTYFIFSFFPAASESPSDIAAAVHYSPGRKRARHGQRWSEEEREKNSRSTPAIQQRERDLAENGDSVRLRDHVGAIDDRYAHCVFIAGRRALRFDQSRCPAISES